MHLVPEDQCRTLNGIDLYSNLLLIVINISPVRLKKREMEDNKN